MKAKVRPLNLHGLPEYVWGRLRKDGKPDRRYRNGLLMLGENIKACMGVHSALVGRKEEK